MKAEILNSVKEIVIKKFPDSKIYLYGSRARREHHKNSDWDFLILLKSDKVDLETEREITYPIYELEFETGETISPMVYSEKEWNEKYKNTPYYFNVTNDGVQI